MPFRGVHVLSNNTKDDNAIKKNLTTWPLAFVSMSSMCVCVWFLVFFFYLERKFPKRQSIMLCDNTIYSNHSYVTHIFYIVANNRRTTRQYDLLMSSSAVSTFKIPCISRSLKYFYVRVGLRARARSFAYVRLNIFAVFLLSLSLHFSRCTLLSLFEYAAFQQ